MQKTCIYLGLAKCKFLDDCIKKNLASSYPCLCLRTKKHVQRFLNISTSTFVYAGLPAFLSFIHFYWEPISRLDNLQKAGDIKLSKTKLLLEPMRKCANVLSSSCSNRIP